MGLIRSVSADVLRAVLVLALLALNFAHAGAAPSSVDTWSLTGQALYAAADCGAPDPMDGAPHAPCHACRIGGAANLPPEPCIAEPVRFAAPAGYAVAIPSPAANATPIYRLRSRAPPLAA